jgi:DNA-binding LytR/AlgR family response regulator
MNTKVLVFEDEVYTAKEIAIRLKNAGYLDVDIAVTKKQAFKAIENSYPDIAILDIREADDKEAGLKIAKYLRQKNPIPIIYYTANPDDKPGIYETRPNAFIEKPNIENVIHAIDLAVKNFHGEVDEVLKNEEDPHYFSKDYLFILKKGLYCKVKHEDILYVESDSGCIIIHTSGGEFSYSSTIKRFTEQVNDPNFLRIHKSYLINLFHIESFNNQQVTISGKEMPMSKRGYENLLSVVRRLKAK